MINAGDIALAMPLYFANASLLPVMRLRLLGGMHRLDSPVSERLFGRSRTCLGSGLIFAVTTGGYWLLFGSPCPWPALGMIAGVHASSLLKRSLSMQESGPLPFVDQLDFFAGGAAGLALCGFFFSDLPMMLVITFFVHLFSNMVAHAAGLKDVWW